MPNLIYWVPVEGFRGEVGASLNVGGDYWRSKGADFVPSAKPGGERRELAVGRVETPSGSREFGILDYGDGTSYLMVPSREELGKRTEELLAALEHARAISRDQHVIDQVPVAEPQGVKRSSPAMQNALRRAVSQASRQQSRAGSSGSGEPGKYSVAMQSQEVQLPQTVAAMLDEATERIAASGVEDPRANAEVLIADAVGVNPDDFDAEGGSVEVSAAIAEKIERYVQRRVNHEPMAYILGRAPFRNLEIYVDERVLWPRRETELLVEVGTTLPEGARVHEVGTGSGAIALALMLERPDLRITASDLSPEAAEVACENAERLGLDLDVTIAAGLPEEITAEDIDLVIANLPYVTDETIYERSPEIQREPRIAVTGDCGEDGLGVIRSLIAETPSGWKMALEHDTHHGPAMRELLRDATTLQDYEGDERVTVGYAP